MDPLVGRASRPRRGGHRAPGREPAGGVRPVRQAYDRPDAVRRSYLADLAAGDADLAQLAGRVAQRMFAVPMPQVAPDGSALDVGDPAVRRELTRASSPGARRTPA